MESRPGVTIQRGITTRVTIPRTILIRVTIQRGILTRGHNSTLSYDPGSHFNVELWPWVKISRWIMTRVIVPHWIMIKIPSHNWTLNHDTGVTIQRGIKTWGHNSTWNKDLGSQFNEGVLILSVGGVVIQWPPVTGVAIQHEKSVESWAQPVELRPHGSKFNGVKIQSYTVLKRTAYTDIVIYNLKGKSDAYSLWLLFVSKMY